VVVHRIAGQADQLTEKPFDQIILAAADVDADRFRQRCSAYSAVARRTTLYVSTHDLALALSRWLHDFPRAGFVPPVLVVPGIDTVKVTNFDLTNLGHGYVAEARELLGDIYQLIAHGDPPRRRFGIRLVSNNSRDDPDFWQIGP
jgi:esterase/lipase superfamily enzyme